MRIAQFIDKKCEVLKSVNNEIHHPGYNYKLYVL